MLPPLEITVGSEGSPSLSSFKKPLMAKSIQKPNDSKSRTSKKVSFHRRVKIKKIRPFTMFTEEERDAIWHNLDEYTDIKRGCIGTLRKMMQEGFEECDEFCPRGLEVRTKAASATRKQVRAIAAQAVFDEQEDQNECCAKNEERIRDAYMDVAREAEDRAHHAALQDARVSLQYLKAA